MLADLEARDGEGQVLRLRWKRTVQEGKEGVTRIKYNMVLVLAQLGRSHLGALKGEKIG